MIESFTISEAGGRARNEDAFEVVPHPNQSESRICFLADGQGGRAGGGQAARLACRIGIESACLEDPGRLLLPATWTRVFRECDEAVNADSEAGFTTLIGFVVSDGAICGGSNGDSAAAALDSERWIELTRGQAKNPPIGSGDAAFVPFTTKLRQPWTVVAMSDGVWKYCKWDRIEAAVRECNGQTLLDSLIAAARLPNGKLQDDFTTVVLTHKGDPKEVQG